VGLVSRPAVFRAFVLCLVAVLFGYFAADGYIERLPNHAGYHLVSIEDTPSVLAERPRYTVVVVVDGLTQAYAKRLVAVRTLREHGQCRVMEVGPITISRPVYSVLSTGLEQDRAGSRNNDETRPLFAESIWQVARRSGRSVAAASGEPWWQELFPDGFDRYVVATDEQDVFAQVPFADLMLVHPLYVDHEGHAHGAGSDEYAKAAARVGRELSAFLQRLDLARDLVVFTSDHGHTSYGGHGGVQDEVREVLTCFAGRGVARSAALGRMHFTALAPTVALLTGLRFPQHLRALEDDLDVTFAVADHAAFPPEYLAERRAAVLRARETNRAALATWLGPGAEPSWAAFYGRERRRQHLRLALGVLVIVAGLVFSLRRREPGVRELLRFVLWAVLVVGATIASYAALRGGLDFTSINRRSEFVASALLVCAVNAGLGVVLHRLLRGETPRLLADELTLVAVSAALIALHPLVYGWPLGFPLPGPRLLFFPFIAPVFLMVHAALAAGLCARALRRSEGSG
jgi:hypothetical protein